LRAGKPATMYIEEFRSPILVHDVASALVELVALPALRVLHVGGPERVNRLDMGYAIAQQFGLDASLCIASTHDAKGTGLTRPPDTSMCPDLARQVLRSPPRGLRAACAALL
jgi:dTDP-4-dehydrorhamnose reductase